MSNLDTQSLQAFIAVATQGSFSRGAAQIHLTQPAISKRIAALEGQLGAKLFNRFKKQVSLTEAGRVLLPLANDILLSLDEAKRAIRDLDNQVSGRLSIAFSHHIGLHRLPSYLREYSRRYPQVALDIDFIDSERGYDKVVNGDVEIAVITLSEGAINPAIKTTSLWKDPLVFVCSPDHELHLRNNVSLKELAALNVVLPGKSTYTGKILNDLFTKQGFHLNESMTTNYLETIKMMVSIGLGWSVLPRTMCRGLEIIHVPDTYLERNLGIIEHRNRRSSNAASAFKALLASNDVLASQ